MVKKTLFKYSSVLMSVVLIFTKRKNKHNTH